MMHQCSVCLKQFKFLSKLHRHQLTHSGQRPFTCSICRKSFRQSAHLKGHLESHIKQGSVSVTGPAESQSSGTKSEGSYSPFVETQANIFERTELSEDLELVDQSMWCSALQTHNESVWKHDEERRLAENAVRNTTHSFTVTSPSQTHSEDNAAQKQMSDVEQWDYSVGGVTEKENHYQHSQHVPGPEKREQADVIPSERRPQTDVAVSDGACGQTSLGKMQSKPRRNQCATCLKCFSSPSKLRRHVLIHTSQRPFGCHLCGKAFRQLAHLKIHMTTHYSQRQSRARQERWHVPQNQDELLSTSVQYCPRPSEGRWAVQDDPRVASVTKKPASNQLPPKNVGEFQLDGQTLSKGQIMHECPVCFKLFSAPSKLRRHCLIHTGQRPFQCSTCHRSFRQLAHLKAHYSVHTGPCKKRTSSLQALKYVNQHQPPPSKTRLKRFVCNSLGRKFRSGRHLNVSIDKCKTSPPSVLAGQSPTEELAGDRNTSGRDSLGVECSDRGGRDGYWCTVCSKHFSAPSKLKRHLLIHTGQRPFKCLVCSRAYRQRSHLKGHRCKGEGRGASDAQLTEELDSHGVGSNITEGVVNGEQPFTCGTVDSMDSCIPSGTFTAPSDLSPGHRNELTSLPYRGDAEVPGILVAPDPTKDRGHRCTMCLKMFHVPSKVSRQLRIHMDIEPFTCAVCMKSLRQLSHLQSHERVHTAKRRMLFKVGHKHKTVTPKAAAASETFQVLSRKVQDQGSENLVVQKLDPDCAVMRSNGDQDVPLSKCNKSGLSSEELAFNFTAETINVPALDDSKDKSRRTRNTDVSAQVAFEDASGYKRQNQCTYCLKTFDFPSKLSRHLRIHTGIRPYKCHVCHKSFKQLSHLQCHYWIHREDKTMVVGHLLKQQNPISSGCATSSKEEGVAGHHQKSNESLTMAHQGHDPYVDQEKLPDWNPVGFGPMDQCGPSGSDPVDGEFKSELDLQMEISNRAVHLDLKHETGEIGADGVSRSLDWDCQDQLDMNKPSTEEGTEGKHPRDVHCCVPEDCSNRSPTVSDCCRLGFSHEQPEPPDFGGHKKEAAQEDYEKHLIEPPNDLPMCPNCNECFPTLKKLHAHKCPMQVPKESLRKSYHCAVCFKSFKAPSKLKRHYMIHTGQRPFQCTMCNKAFTQSSHLKTHIMSHR